MHTANRRFVAQLPARRSEVIRHRAPSAMALIASAMVIVAPTLANAAIMDGLSPGTAGYSAKQIQSYYPASSSGNYWIDPDGAGAGAPFLVYTDMTSAGGGWTLGLNSLNGSTSSTTDMVSNTGTVGPSTAHTRNMNILAISATAQIRHVIRNTANNVVFDGYYTGDYHGTMAAAGSWTVLSGNISVMGVHPGNDWSTATNDVDTYSGNCATVFGVPWYYTNCWNTIPVSLSTTVGGPFSNSTQQGQYSIYVRELVTPTFSLPEINVTGNTNNIPDGSTTINGTGVGEINTSYGTVITGAPTVTHTFTVHNTGTADLTITSPTSITGGSPFSVSTALPGTIAASGSASLGVQMATGTVGNFTRTVNVSNDDIDENAYNFNVAGTVLEHSKGEFRSQGLGGAVSQMLASGDQILTINFGTVYQGAGGGLLDSFFDIFAEVNGPSSLLTARLTLDSVTGGGAGFVLPGISTFSDMLAGLLAGSSDYTARFITTTVGSFSASFLFNMSDEHAYDGLGATPHTLTLNLIGNVQAAPSIPIPEPSTLTLLGLGAVGLAIRARRRRCAT